MSQGRGEEVKRKRGNGRTASCIPLHVVVASGATFRAHEAHVRLQKNRRSASEKTPRSWTQEAAIPSGHSIGRAVLLRSLHCLLLNSISLFVEIQEASTATGPGRHNTTCHAKPPAPKHIRKTSSSNRGHLCTTPRCELYQQTLLAQTFALWQNFGSCQRTKLDQRTVRVSVLLGF